MEKKIKKIIAREILIVVSLFVGVSVLLLWSNSVAEVPLPHIDQSFFIILFFFVGMAYGFYWLIRLINWAIRTLKEK